ncbi:serine-rich adhesin for platelets-like [Cherax quadricarinatus]
MNTYNFTLRTSLASPLRSSRTSPRHLQQPSALSEDGEAVGRERRSRRRALGHASHGTLEHASHSTLEHVNHEALEHASHDALEGSQIRDASTVEYWRRVRSLSRETRHRQEARERHLHKLELEERRRREQILSERKKERDILMSKFLREPLRQHRAARAAKVASVESCVEGEARATIELRRGERGGQVVTSKSVPDLEEALRIVRGEDQALDARARVFLSPHQRRRAPQEDQITCDRFLRMHSRPPHQRLGPPARRVPAPATRPFPPGFTDEVNRENQKPYPTWPQEELLARPQQARGRNSSESAYKTGATQVLSDAFSVTSDDRDAEMMLADYPQPLDSHVLVLPRPRLDRRSSMPDLRDFRCVSSAVVYETVATLSNLGEARGLLLVPPLVQDDNTKVTTSVTPPDIHQIKNGGEKSQFSPKKWAQKMNRFIERETQAVLCASPLLGSLPPSVGRPTSQKGRRTQRKEWVSKHTSMKTLQKNVLPTTLTDSSSQTEGIHIIRPSSTIHRRNSLGSEGTESVYYDSLEEDENRSMTKRSVHQAFYVPIKNEEASEVSLRPTLPARLTARLEEHRTTRHRPFPHSSSKLSLTGKRTPDASLNETKLDIITHDNHVNENIVKSDSNINKPTIVATESRDPGSSPEQPTDASHSSITQMSSPKVINVIGSSSVSLNDHMTNKNPASSLNLKRPKAKVTTVAMSSNEEHVSQLPDTIVTLSGCDLTTNSDSTHKAKSDLSLKNSDIITRHTQENLYLNTETGEKWINGIHYNVVQEEDVNYTDTFHSSSKIYNEEFANDGSGLEDNEMISVNVVTGEISNKLIATTNILSDECPSTLEKKMERQERTGNVSHASPGKDVLLESGFIDIDDLSLSSDSISINCNQVQQSAQSELDDMPKSFEFPTITQVVSPTQREHCRDRQPNRSVALLQSSPCNVYSNEPSTAHLQVWEKQGYNDNIHITDLKEKTNGETGDDEIRMIIKATTHDKDYEKYLEEGTYTKGTKHKYLAENKSTQTEIKEGQDSQPTESSTADVWEAQCYDRDVHHVLSAGATLKTSITETRDQEVLSQSTDHSEGQVLVPSSQFSEDQVLVPSSQFSEGQVLVPSSQFSEDQVLVPSSQFSEDQVLVPSSQPSEDQVLVPSTQPSEQQVSATSPEFSEEQDLVPSEEQVLGPSPEPSEEHVLTPSPEPAEEHVLAPSPEPSEEQVLDPSPEPSEEQVLDPSPEPSEERVLDPSPEPSEEQVLDPSPEPSEEQVLDPSPEPSEEQVLAPSFELSEQQVMVPRIEFSEEQVLEHNPEPTEEQVLDPSPEPTEEQVLDPSPEPTEEQVLDPSPEPSVERVLDPSPEPTEEQSSAPHPESVEGRTLEPIIEGNEEQCLSPGTGNYEKQTLDSSEEHTSGPATDSDEKRLLVPITGNSEKHQLFPAVEASEEQTLFPSRGYSVGQPTSVGLDVAEEVSEGTDSWDPVTVVRALSASTSSSRNITPEIDPEIQRLDTPEQMLEEGILGDSLIVSQPTISESAPGDTITESLQGNISDVLMFVAITPSTVDQMPVNQTSSELSTIDEDEETSDSVVQSPVQQKLMLTTELTLSWEENDNNAVMEEDDSDQEKILNNYAVDKDNNAGILGNEDSVVGERDNSVVGEDNTVVEGEDNTVVEGEDNTVVEGEDNTVVEGEDNTVVEGGDNIVVDRRESLTRDRDEDIITMNKDDNVGVDENQNAVVVAGNDCVVRCSKKPSETQEHESVADPHETEKHEESVADPHETEKHEESVADPHETEKHEESVADPHETEKHEESVADPHETEKHEERVVDPHETEEYEESVVDPHETEEYEQSVGDPHETEEREESVGDPHETEKHEESVADPHETEKHEESVADPHETEKHEESVADPHETEKHEESVADPHETEEREESVGDPHETEEHEESVADPHETEEHEESVADPHETEKHEESVADPHETEKHEESVADPHETEKHEESVADPHETEEHEESVADPHETEKHEESVADLHETEEHEESVGDPHETEEHEESVVDPHETEKHEESVADSHETEEHESVGDPHETEKHEKSVADPHETEEHEESVVDPHETEEHEESVVDPHETEEHEESVVDPHETEEHEECVVDPHETEEYEQSIGDPHETEEHEESVVDPHETEEHEESVVDPHETEEHEESVVDPHETDESVVDPHETEESVVDPHETDESVVDPHETEESVVDPHETEESVVDPHETEESVVDPHETDESVVDPHETEESVVDPHETDESVVDPHETEEHEESVVDPHETEEHEESVVLKESEHLSTSAALATTSVTHKQSGEKLNIGDNRKNEDEEREKDTDCDNGEIDEPDLGNLDLSETLKHEIGEVEVEGDTNVASEAEIGEVEVEGDTNVASEAEIGEVEVEGDTNVASEAEIGEVEVESDTNVASEAEIGEVEVEGDTNVASEAEIGEVEIEYDSEDVGEEENHPQGSRGDEVISATHDIDLHDTETITVGTTGKDNNNDSECEDLPMEELSEAASRHPVLEAEDTQASRHPVLEAEDTQDSVLSSAASRRPVLEAEDTQDSVLSSAASRHPVLEAEDTQDSVLSSAASRRPVLEAEDTRDSVLSSAALELTAPVTKVEYAELLSHVEEYIEQKVSVGQRIMPSTYNSFLMREALENSEYLMNGRERNCASLLLNKKEESPRDEEYVTTPDAKHGELPRHSDITENDSSHVDQNILMNYDGEQYYLDKKDSLENSVDLCTEVNTVSNFKTSVDDELPGRHGQRKGDSVQNSHYVASAVPVMSTGQHSSGSCGYSGEDLPEPSLIARSSAISEDSPRESNESAREVAAVGNSPSEDSGVVEMIGKNVHSPSEVSVESVAAVGDSSQEFQSQESARSKESADNNSCLRPSSKQTKDRANCFASGRRSSSGCGRELRETNEATETREWASFQDLRDGPDVKDLKPQRRQCDEPQRNDFQDLPQQKDSEPTSVSKHRLVQEYVDNLQQHQDFDDGSPQGTVGSPSRSTNTPSDNQSDYEASDSGEGSYSERLLKALESRRSRRNRPRSSNIDIEDNPGKYRPSTLSALDMFLATLSRYRGHQVDGGEASRNTTPPSLQPATDDNVTVQVRAGPRQHDVRISSRRQVRLVVNVGHPTVSSDSGCVPDTSQSECVGRRGGGGARGSPLTRRRGKRLGREGGAGPPAAPTTTPAAAAVNKEVDQLLTDVREYLNSKLKRAAGDVDSGDIMVEGSNIQKCFRERPDGPGRARLYPKERGRQDRPGKTKTDPTLKEQQRIQNSINAINALLKQFS